MLSSLFRYSKNWYSYRAKDYKNKDSLLFDWIDSNYDLLYSCSKIYIYGTDAQSFKVYDYLRQLNFDKLIFIENNPYKRKKIEAISIESIRNYNTTYCIIVISSVNDEKIRQLQKKSIPKEKILVYEHKKSLKKLYLYINNKIKFYCQIFNALNLYTKIKKQYPNKKIFVCPYPGTGDIFFTGDIFHLILKKEKIDEKEYVIFIGSNSCKVILEHFQINNVIVIPQKQIELFKIICSIFSSTQTNILYLGFWGLNFQRIARLGYIYKLPFKDLLHSLFLGELPSENNVKNIIFKNNLIDLKKTFEEQVDFKKIIILAPVAGVEFNEGISIIFWEKLAYSLSELGFIVYTNTNGEDFPVIKHTKKLFLDYDNFYNLLNQCKALIGLRSGLFDIMNSVKCNKVILYPPRYSETLYNFFSLKNNYKNVIKCHEIMLLDANNILKLIIEDVMNEYN